MSEKPNKLSPALYGGIVMGVISGVPFLNLLNCFCCAGILLGGFLAVFFYTRDLTPESPPLSSSDGLQLGAYAGLFGAVIGTTLSAVFLLAVGNMSAEFIAALLREMSDIFPEETLEQLDQAFEQSRELTPLAVVWQFMYSIIIDPLFGLLGGLIGYSVYKPKPVTVNLQPPSTPAA
jgi:hypothetical protein